jgi:hypothetical protein
LAVVLVLVLVLALSQPEKGPSSGNLVTSLPPRLTLPSRDDFLADPSQRVVPAQQVVLDPSVPASAFVSFGAPPLGGSPASELQKDIGPLVFTFTVASPDTQVTFNAYLNGDLVDIASLNTQNSPYAFSVQEGDEYGRGPITTTVMPANQFSTIKGAIHYLANGADQFYEGLLFYWQVSSP